MRHRPPPQFLPFLLMCLLGLALAACQPITIPPRPQPSPPVETPALPGKPLVVPGVPGLYVAWAQASDAVPPTRAPGDPAGAGNHVLGFDCLAYLGAGGDIGIRGVWDRRQSIDWRPYDNCLQQAAQRTVTLPDGATIPQPVVLTLPASFSDTGSRWYNTAGHDAPGSADNPFMRLHLPPWMQNDAYRFAFRAPSGQWYQSIKYNGEFKARMIEFVQAAGQRYNGNPQVSVVRVYVGVQGESQPVIPCQSYWEVLPPAGRDQFECAGDSFNQIMREHEKVVSCEGYTAFVRELSEAAFRAFPDKSVVSIVDVGPCSTVTQKGFRRSLYEGPWATQPIGVSMNNLNLDRPDVDERVGNRLTRWNAWTVGRTLRGMGYPMLYEFDAHKPSVEAMYWTVLSGAGNGGNFILYHQPWASSLSAPTWEVVDYWLASERRAWLVFRDREYPTYDYADGYGLSGSIGDFEKYLHLLNPEQAPQACSPALAKAARAANATVTAKTANFNVTQACPDAILPAPAITPAATPSPGADLYTRLFNRQARRLDPGITWRIAVSGDWPAFGENATAQVAVSYFDTGRDMFEVTLAGANGQPVSHIIQKTGTGTWKRAEWTADVLAGNILPDDTFIRITNDGAGVEYLHEVFVTMPKGLLLAPTPAPALSPSVAPTFTLTAAPTRTPTPAPSATVTPLPTPSSTATATALPASPTATATARPTATWTPIPPTPTRTATPTPTATLAPTATPTATLTPRSPADCLPRSLGTVALAGPRGLTASSRGFYAALFESSELALVDPASRARMWQVPAGPGRSNGVAVWGDTAIVTNRDRGAVTLRNALTGEQRITLTVGALPWGVAAADGRAYVANFGDNTLSVIDLAAARVLRTTSVAETPVTAVAAGGQVYLLHLNGAITRLDRDGNALGQAASGLNDTRGIGYDLLRGRLYVGSEAGAVAALRLPDLAPVARFELPGPAYAIAVNPGTGRIYAVDAQNDLLYVIEPDGAVVAQLPLPPQGDAQGGQGLAAWGNVVGVANFAANSLSFFDDSACSERVTPAPSLSPTAAPPAPTAMRTALIAPTRTATAAPTRLVTVTPSLAPKGWPSASPTPTATRQPTPSVVRAKVEIVWPHGGVSVEQAERANVTVYLLAGDGTAGARSLLDSVPCAWSPTVRLWAARGNEPARQVGIGQKRMFTDGGRTFPVWDFNDVDVSYARDPAHKLAFTATVDGVKTLSNVWTHAADARTLFPQQDVPTGVSRLQPAAVDARIQIVWPHGNLPPQEARFANVTAFLFGAGTMQAVAPDAVWSPTVRLRWSLNNEPEASPGTGVIGAPRVVEGANGVRFVAWDFNDIDVRVANDGLNRLTFRVTVDGAQTHSNFWAHAVDARTLFPQADALNSCR